MERRIAIEIIPDLDEGGVTARVPDIPAYGEGETEDEASWTLKKPFTLTSKSSGSMTPEMCARLWSDDSER